MLVLVLASFAVALLPLLVAGGVSSIARAAYARGVRIPRVMRAGPWLAPCDASEVVPGAASHRGPSRRP